MESKDSQAKVSASMIALDPMKDMWGARFDVRRLEWIHVPSPLDAALHHEGSSARSQSFFRYCITAAHSGDANAVAILALMIYNGWLDDGKCRLERSRSLAEISSSVGNEYGQFMLALVSIEEGELRIAARLLMQSSNSGFAPSAWFLGKIYEHGIGVHQDIEASVECYRTADRDGYFGAQRTLADLGRIGSLGFLAKVRYTILYPWYLLCFYINLYVRGRHFQTHLAPQRALDELLEAIQRKQGIQ